MSARPGTQGCRSAWAGAVGRAEMPRALPADTHTNRSQYFPHQSRRERARRMRKLAQTEATS